MSRPRKEGSLRNYARLSSGWFRDEVIVACSRREPAALWLWPVLVAKAKDASHADDNPTGIFSTSVGELADDLRLPGNGTAEKRVDRALRLLIEGELLTVEWGGPMDTILIELARFRKWQNAKGSGADRQQSSRDGKAISSTNAPERDGAVTTRDDSVTQKKREREIKKESREEDQETPLSPPAPRTRQRRAPRNAPQPMALPGAGMGDLRSTATARGVNYDAGIEHVD